MTANHPSDPARVVRVAVAILAYRRPEYLRLLLQRAALLTPPADAEVTFLVIDNDPDGSARPITATASLPWPVEYRHEPRRGIPMARNRALSEARKLGADIMCFIDDDEYPVPRWLDLLVATWRETGAHIVGGAVEVAATPAERNRWQRFINASLAARATRKNVQTAEAAATGRRFSVTTANWLGDLAFFEQHGLTFDESLRDTGGEDTLFFKQAKQAGARAAWCNEAAVYESMPPQRLTFGYHFKRAAMQSMENFRLSWPEVTPKAVMRTVAIVPIRLLSGLLLLVIPIYGIASPVTAVRSLGWACGRIAALLGRRSTLYAAK